MKVKWKDWCRFCGSAELTTKFEYTSDLRQIFQISDLCMVCQFCCSYLSEFQEFYQKSKDIHKLSLELSKYDEYLNGFEANEFRLKFGLNPLEIEDSLESIPPLELEVEGDDIKPLNEFVEIKVENYYFNFDEENDQTEHDNPVPATSDKKPKRSEIVKDQRKLPKRRRTTKSYKKFLDPENENADCDDIKEDPDYKDLDIEDSESEEKREYNPIPKFRTNKYEELPGFPLICHICNEDFSKRAFPHLIKHCKDVHACRPAVLCVCGFTLNNVDSFYKHRKKCVRKNRSPFECDLCGATYNTRKTIDDHMELRHKIDSAKVICPDCGLAFFNQYTYKIHAKNHLPKGERIHECHICLKRFACPKILKYHIKGVHESTTEYQCHICPSVLKSKRALKAHLQATHAKSADFPCPTCPVKCRSKDLLRTHMQTHSSKKFECSLCYKMFRRQSTLNKHVRYIHTHTNERPFTCEQCNRDFKRSNDLKTHLKSVHGPADQFHCRWCPSAFNRSANRNRHHKLYHTAEYAKFLEENPAEKFLT